MVERFKLGVGLSLALSGAIIMFSADLSRSAGYALIALGLTIVLAGACVSTRRLYVGKVACAAAIVLFLGKAFCVGPTEDGAWTVVCRGGELCWVQRSPFAVKWLYDERLRVPKTGVTLIERPLRDKRGLVDFAVHWSVAEQDLGRYVAAHREGQTVELLLEELFPHEMIDEELVVFKKRCRQAGVSIGGIYQGL